MQQDPTSPTNPPNPPNPPSPAPLEYISVDLQQQQSRRTRCLASTALITLILGAAVAIGAQFNRLDDSLRGGGYIATLALLATAASGIALLAIGAAVISRARFGPAIAAVILVLLSVFASIVLFDLGPLRPTFGQIRGTETPAERAANSFVLRLYLCWMPSLIIGAGALLLSRRRRHWLGLVAVLFVGLVSAILWASQAYAPYHRWLIPMKWPKFLSTGLFFLVLLLLTQLLAGAIDTFRTRPDPRARNISQ